VSSGSSSRGYVASPRPTFERPTAIPYAGVARHVWGDDGAGEVMDWIYVSSGSIHQLVFGLPSGGAFRHSDEFRTIFASDELLYVLSGTMLLANPATGEVHRVRAGEAAFFRRDTWHHAFSHGEEQLRVLEFMAPTPSAGAAGAYARAQPLLEGARYELAPADGWPLGRRAVEDAFTIRVVRDADVLWQLAGAEDPMLVGVMAHTEHLHAGLIELRGGQRGPLQEHPGDLGGYVLSGAVALRDESARGWHELGPRDGFFVPQGSPHRFQSLSSEPARIVWGVGIPAADG